uniref:PTS sugar transporter subunit IIA n=1 Tax=Enterococcus sp. DIV0849a TaxID=2230879 RepID=UPI00403E2590
MPVANGEVIAIDQVDDPVFSQKMMGDGFAVIPTDTTIYAPIDGTITSIFPSKHALGITTTEGIEVLIHMGLDTIEMKESAFTIHVVEGQKITAGEIIATADLDKIKSAGKQTTMIVVFTNGEKINAFHLEKTGKQDPGTAIGCLEI